MINENFVYIGIIISAVGGLSYAIKTFKGEIQPNRITWLLWGLAPLIAFAAQIEQGVGIWSLLTLLLVIDPLIIFIASFFNKKAYWKLEKIDFIFGGLSIVGLILWQITGVGNIAILFTIFADIFAAIPTLIKSYHEPESENSLTYFATAIGTGIIMFTIQDWNFQTSAFIIYNFVICIILAFLIQFKIGLKLSSNK